MSNPSALMSPHRFASLGVEELVYVKPAQKEERGVAIYAADGCCVAIVDDLKTARIAIWRRDLNLASLH